MATSISSKSINPFQSNQWNHFDQFASSSSSSLITSYYENDILHNEAPTFRSVSPKIYHPEQQKKDYFLEMSEELEFGDDCDALYEDTLMDSHFLESLQEEQEGKPCIYNTKPIDRLYQLLGHISPTYQAEKPTALSNVLAQTTPSVRSQFSAATASGQQAQTVPNTMVAISMSDPRDFKGKGKGKFKPTL